MQELLMNKIFLVNFPSFHETNFNRYFTFLQICGIQNPVNLQAFNFKSFLSGYTISFNVELLKNKFPDALFVHFRTPEEIIYNQMLFCRGNCLFNGLIFNDFNEYLNLDLSNFTLEDLKEKNKNYNEKINTLFKNNKNFIDLGLIENFTDFVLGESKLKDFFYIHGLDSEFNINALKETIKNKETKFLDYLDFKSSNLRIPSFYTLNSLVSDFIFPIPFNLEDETSLYKNLKKEIENAY
jgi:hypothetical protein